MARPLLGIPRELRRDVAVGFFAFLGVLTAHSMLETARDALFLAELPPSHLPLVYLAIAGLALAVARLNARAMVRYSPRRLLALTLAGAGVLTVLLWPFVGLSRLSLYALYVWTGLVATLAVTQLWMLLGEQFDVGQAKRAFALIAAGGLIGATLGAALAGAILQIAPPRHLVAVAGAILALTAAAPFCLRRGERRGFEARERRQLAWRSRGAFGHRYLRRLLVMLALATLTVTTGELLFKTVIADKVPAASLGGFFAVFYAALNALALVVQVFFASRLLRVLGVSRALWVLPLLLLASAVGFVLTVAIVPVMLLKIFDGALRHSLHRTGVELLYLPLPAGVRNRHKVVVDALGSRGGQALAALAVLSVALLGGGPLALGVLVLVLGSLWLASVAGIKRHYVEMFREQLRQGTIETRAHAPELDLHSLETLIAALSSPDELVVVNALDLLNESGRANLIPALILYHPSREVVLRALEILTASGRTDFTPLARRLLQSIDPAIRAAALQALARVEPDEEILRASLGDASPAVRSTALVGLVCCEMCSEVEMQALLSEAIAGEPEARRALARAIRHQPEPAFTPVLRRLAAVEDSELRAEVARAVAASPDPVSLPELLAMLADRGARPDARAALLAIGGPALDALDDAMGDESLPYRVRLHLPRTISRFADDRAASILIRHLGRERDSTVGYKILRGLGRLVADRPFVRLDRERLAEVLRYMLRRAITLVSWQRGLEREQELRPQHRTQGAELLFGILQEKERSCVERVFRLLGILHPREDFAALYSGLLADDGKTRAYSRELLEYLVDLRMRDAILGLMGGASPSEKLAAARAYYEPQEEAYIAQLRAMLVDRIEAIRCLAAHHTAELQLEELRPQLSKVREESHGLTAEVVGQALELLSRGQEVSHAT